MVRKVTALLIAAILSLPACGFATSTPASVQALQRDGQTFCTAFSINEAEGYWATAAHCAAYVVEEDFDATIMGQGAWIVSISFPSADVAVFQSSAHAPAFHLAKAALNVGDPLSIIGYPYGITRTQTFGRMAARNIPIQHPSTNYYMTSDILDITTAGGNSGSPVLNAKGELIGVLWGGFTESPHSLAAPLESTRRALAGFTER